MNNAENFILNTDYATLKNDQIGSVQVSLPPKILSANEIYTASQDITIGTINASARIRIASDHDGGDFYAGNLTNLTRAGQQFVPGDSPYSVIGYTSRISPGVLRASVTIQNPYSYAIATETVTEVLTFEISTFISPFV